MTVAGQITDERLDKVIARLKFEFDGVRTNTAKDILLVLTELQHRREAEADHVADAGKKVAADGWVLVPRDLTLEMEQAHYDAHAKAETVFASAPEVWSAILASAPKPNHLGGRLICEALGFDPTNHHKAWSDSFVGLQNWRDEDNEDAITLTRDDIISLIEDYRSALGEHP